MNVLIKRKDAHTKTTKATQLPMGKTPLESSTVDGAEPATHSNGLVRPLGPACLTMKRHLYSRSS